MNKKSMPVLILILLAMLISPLAAHATQEVWNFWGPQVPFQNAASSNPATYITQGTATVTNADGYTVQLTPYANYNNLPAQGNAWLTGRDQGAGSDERGAGVCIGANCIVNGVSTTYEINGSEAIKVILDPSRSHWQLRFNSLDGGDIVHLWAIAPTAGLGGISLGTATHVAGEFESLSIPDIYRLNPIYVVSDQTDVLLYGAVADTVPEPSTMLLLGAGLGGLALWRRKTRK